MIFTLEIISFGKIFVIPKLIIVIKRMVKRFSFSKVLKTIKNDFYGNFMRV